MNNKNSRFSDNLMLLAWLLLLIIGVIIIDLYLKLVCYLHYNFEEVTNGKHYYKEEV